MANTTLVWFIIQPVSSFSEHPLMIIMILFDEDEDLLWSFIFIFLFFSNFLCTIPLWCSVEVDVVPLLLL